MALLYMFIAIDMYIDIFRFESFLPADFVIPDGRIRLIQLSLFTTKKRFSEIVSLKTKFVFSYSIQILGEAFLILRIIQRDIITKLHTDLRKVPVIIVRFS